MTDTHSTPPHKDWNELAKEALDLWQDHLNTLASDPKLKDDMVRLVTPMTQMFAQWTSLAQAGMRNMPGFEDMDMSGVPSDSPAPPEATAYAQPDNAAVKTTDDGAASHVQSAASDQARGDVRDETTGSVDEDVYALDIDSILAVNMVKPRSKPVVVVVPPAEPKFESKPEPVAMAPTPTAGGRAPSADGHRDLAELANRLAQLERELDGLRPSRRGAADAAMGDAGTSVPVQRVVGAD